MRKDILALFTATAAILCSCSSKQYREQGSEKGKEFATGLSEPQSITASETAAGEKVAETETLSNQSTVNKKKIIKDGNMSVKTHDINARKKDIDECLKKLNAYYEREDLQNHHQTISYDLKIRVPADNFEKLISSIENGKDEIKSKTIQARDVTEEYVDIEMRLASKREYLKRYKELVSKALTIKDILAIEASVRELQEEIESKEGRLKYLSDQVSFSSLDLNLYQTKEFIYKPEPQDKFSERVKKSLTQGWTSAVDFALWAMTIWHIILALVAFFVIRRAIKKRKKRNRNDE
ncbi:MAG: hypothetical protein CRN43_14885 [Candidatus Nephrothrix sp. EaCA]|nr:MAG: hypothetical protein CRN43_14885 [Candidatus Nephrothrix sp. EaCA]